MASIIGIRRENNSVVLEVSAGYEEFLELKGHMEDIHFFTEKVAEVKTNISQRGKNEATKYFLIPRELRKGFSFNNSTSCQKMELKDKVVFVYVVDKLATNPLRRETTLKKIEARVTYKRNAEAKSSRAESPDEISG
jgi:hypothetical protein